MSDESLLTPNPQRPEPTSLELWELFVRCSFGSTDHAEYMLHQMNPAEQKAMTVGLRAVFNHGLTFNKAERINGYDDLKALVQAFEDREVELRKLIPGDLPGFLVDELREQVATLTAERDHWYNESAAQKKHGDSRAERLQARIAELTAERDERGRLLVDCDAEAARLAADVGRLTARLAAYEELVRAPPAADAQPSRCRDCTDGVPVLGQTVCEVCRFVNARLNRNVDANLRKAVVPTADAQPDGAREALKPFRDLPKCGRAVIENPDHRKAGEPTDEQRAFACRLLGYSVVGDDPAATAIAKRDAARESAIRLEERERVLKVFEALAEDREVELRKLVPGDLPGFLVDELREQVATLTARIAELTAERDERGRLLVDCDAEAAQLAADVGRLTAAEHKENA